MGVVKERANLAPSYEGDFAAWAMHQADAVRRGDWRALDVPNLIEELESMGKQQRAELVNRLAVLLQHLAKFEVQPDAVIHHRSWRNSIEGQREDIEDHLADNPSLKPFIPDAMRRAWRKARRSASQETGLDVSAFAKECPMSFQQAMTIKPWGK